MSTVKFDLYNVGSKEPIPVTDTYILSLLTKLCAARACVWRVAYKQHEDRHELTIVPDLPWCKRTSIQIINQKLWYEVSWKYVDISGIEHTEECIKTEFVSMIPMTKLAMHLANHFAYDRTTSSSGTVTLPKSRDTRPQHTTVTTNFRELDPDCEKVLNDNLLELLA